MLCRADLPHRFAHGIEKGMAGVFHEMPAVGDLIGMWQGLCGGQRISAPTVSCDDFDLRLLDQPRLSSRRLPIWQQCDCLSPLKIANDRAISMIAAPCPIIDADNARWRWRRMIVPANGSQQRIIANCKSDDPQIVLPDGRPTQERDDELNSRGVLSVEPWGGSRHCRTAPRKSSGGTL